MSKVTRNEKRRTGSAIYCAGLDAGILAFKLGEIKDILTEGGESCAERAEALEAKAQELEKAVFKFFDDYDLGRC